MTITPAALTYTSIPENDAPVWNATTAYPAGQIVMLNHWLYEAAFDNTGRNPETDTTFPAAWVKRGATNRYRMFDETVGTVSSAVGTLRFTITPDEFVDSFAVLNAHANVVRITQEDPHEGVVYEKEFELVGNDVDDFWEYFFEPITRRTEVVSTDMPLYFGAPITITLEAPEGEPVSVGHVGLGMAFEIGRARWGSSVGIKDYSVKDEDRWGNWSVKKGPYSDRMELDVIIDTPRVDQVRRELTKLGARLAVYIGHSAFDSLIVAGFYRELGIVLSNPAVSESTISIEGIAR